jgi:hypothetical protein
MSSCRILITSLILLFSFTCRPAHAQEAVGDKPDETSAEKPAEEKPAKSSKEQKPAKSIQEMMTPDEFKAAGLDKLSEDELQHLDAWMQGYRQTTEKTASEKAEKKASEEVKKVTEQANARTARIKLDTLVSRVDGTFEGLKGRTLIKLEDGTVWKQANVEDRYRTQVTDHPAAVVMHGTFGYKMRVEGMPEFYVDPVSKP